jgi:hypothetical protein
MSNKKSNVVDNEVINFYEHLPKKFLTKTVNPHFEKHRIKLPFNMIIAGSTGAGKTNCILNIIYAMPDTFSKIVIITRNKDEALYNYLKEKLPDIEIHEGIHNMPDLDKEFDKKLNNLIIFDDLVAEGKKKQIPIEQYAIRCRKLGVSMAYLTQSWFLTPDVIRKNINYLILKKIPKMNDLERILRDYSLGLKKDDLLQLYNYAIKGEDSQSKKDWFMIDLAEDEESPYKYRKNFSPIKYRFE